MNIKEIIVLVILYLGCLYLWTLPIQKNRMPFAEPDGINFFGIGDWMAQYNKPMWELTGYYMWRYGDEPNNPTYPGTLWYPPPFQTNFALIGIIGGERILPIFLFLAITNSLIVITIYFLLRKLFDFWSAFLASFLLIFSLRDYITHLWGQWSTLISFSFTPLILYCYYRYTSSYLERKPAKRYLYLLSILMASQYLLHPVGTFNAIIFLSIFTIFLIIKYKKLPFLLKDFFGMITLFFILIFIMAPVLFINVLVRTHADTSKAVKEFYFSNLLHFSKPFESGYPPFWYDFTKTIGPYWIIIFLVFGISFLIFRRKLQDFLILSWFIGLYLFLQFLMYHDVGRYVRNIIEIAHIFYPLIALGVVYSISFIKVPSKYKKYLKYTLIIIFAGLIITSIGKAAYTNLKDAYGHPFQRLNQYQYEAATWMKENLKANDDTFDIYSSLIVRDLNNILWFQTIAQKQIRGVKLPWQNNTAEGLEDVYHHDASHVLVDYSRLVMANAQAEINKVQEWEKEYMQNEILVYNKNNIRIYKLRESWYENRTRDYISNYWGNDTTKFKRKKLFGII